MAAGVLALIVLVVNFATLLSPVWLICVTFNTPCIMRVALLFTSKVFVFEFVVSKRMVLLRGNVIFIVITVDQSLCDAFVAFLRVTA